MARDFEQVVFDTRVWLRESGCSRVARKSELGSGFGVIRYAKTLIEEPTEVVEAFEHRTFRGAHMGMLAVRPSIDANLDPINFKWQQPSGMSVMTPLTYRPEQFVPLLSLSGVILDAVYDRLAPVADAINWERIIKNVS
mgnify:CR=1 FL=1